MVRPGSAPPARVPEGFIRSVRDYRREHELLPAGSRVVVGVSGGPDSLALLYVLRDLSGPLRLRLWVAHLDHALRRDSAADSRFVGKIAARLGLPFRKARIEVARLAARGRMSLEEAGRLARYSFFYRTAKRAHAGLVAVGHNRDDQAETVLMRLLRGASASGLGGMAPERRLHDPLAPGRETGSVRLIRPLLGRSRAEIEGFLAFRRVRPRRDPSNLNRGFLRNRIRHDLIPLLERSYNPGIRALLAYTARTLQEEDAFLESIASAVLSRICSGARGRVSLDARRLNRVPLPVRRRLIRLAATRAGATLNRLGRAHLDALARLAAASAGEAHLPGAVAFRSGPRLVIRRTRRRP